MWFHVEEGERFARTTLRVGARGWHEGWTRVSVGVAVVCGSAASAVAALLSSAATMKNYPEAGLKEGKRGRDTERWDRVERGKKKRKRDGRRVSERGRQRTGAERKRLLANRAPAEKREREEDRRSGFFSRPRARVV